MFCEWTELRPLCQWWPGHSELIRSGSNAAWLFITSVSTLALQLCSLFALAVAMVAVVPEGMCNSGTFSVLLFKQVNREASFVTQYRPFSKRNILFYHHKEDHVPILITDWFYSCHSEKYNILQPRVTPRINKYMNVTLVQCACVTLR